MTYKEEAARDRWLRVVPKRMEEVLRRLALLQQCAGPTYSGTVLEEQHVLKTLRAAIDAIEADFRLRHTPKREVHFGFNHDLLKEEEKKGDGRTVLEAG